MAFSGTDTRGPKGRHMLGEALTALAAAGGTVVVQAAGTSGWQGFQRAVARWFARGDEGR